MALTDAYVQVYGQIPQFFEELSKGQAPDQFTVQHLKDLGFSSSNHRALIPLLKELGFLSPEGAPTQRYHDYRNPALSRQVMAQAIREAYGDIFVLRSNPTETDRTLVEGKFKSAHNKSENVAKLMAATFFALADLADLTAPVPPAKKSDAEPLPEPAKVEVEPPKVSPNQQLPAAVAGSGPAKATTTLHYNIQIHLPATKDVEVYNAIFKSLREHLLD
jgi:hypothetical protein